MFTSFCTELIEEYWKTKKQDTPVKTPVKRNKPVKRKSEEAEDTPKRKVKEAREDSGDEDNWENEVKEVETVERTKDKLMIYLLWNNGKRSVHPSDEVNKKCPQKVISFYESHLSFKASS
ncbi:hypothetical protein K493DRAFT_93764 [Basidiobolus meristosporus CBS 931.73]|uniref:Chromo shadow domain-containing protein n=1 Tax=Basidiobolus meristosporus CBS 931.73 TaxID=1314790 RepID=A0A1Y1X7G1_9FUNG|nr:hypothetical protein K493DRAFT_93764 [Basidiobolus meristosporus CBS 931.73]|eukprot:ORX81628.1 hypothetical protein K493DRAFT_93764 [Basidiobolus meristosporus CBS 931.73]